MEKVQHEVLDTFPVDLVLDNTDYLIGVSYKSIYVHMDLNNTYHGVNMEGEGWVEEERVDKNTEQDKNIGN